MRRLSMLLAFIVWLAASGLMHAAEPALLNASGLVLKANADVVIVRPRGPDGQFGKALPLKIRGTSKVFAMSTQKRNEQIVAVQRETEPKDLQPNQPIAAVYAMVNDDAVLLVAIVQAPASK